MTENYKLPDDLLEKLATGSGRVYPYEGRAMAAELIDLRKFKVDSERAPAAQPNFGFNGIPFGFNGIPFGFNGIP